MSKVIILAGGKGERLRPYTEDRPKCMLSVMGRPLLSFTFQWLANHGFTEVYLTCAWRHEVIEEFFGDGRKFGVSIKYIVEREPLGRGGALRKAMDEMGELTEPVLALNGDILTNLNLSELARDFHSSQCAATVVTVPLCSPYGIVEVNDRGAVVGFREKPELPFWINAGIYMLAPRVHDLLPVRGDHEVATFPVLAKQGELSAFQSRAFWRTVDTVKDLGELRNELEHAFFSAFFTAPNVPSAATAR